jgi:cellulose synthase/poly-beta-1,6-N-acetylglucosamine synthase-like glycosyltransferase
MGNASEYIFSFLDVVTAPLIYFVASIYLLALLVILSYSCVQGYLMIRYLQNHKRSNTFLNNDEWPIVTVQAPIYNESEVVERMIYALTKLDYPSEKLQIQVLDDSTDETTQIAERVIHRLKAEKSIDITLVRRPKREGYKAGALRDSMHLIKGDFIAIFDADFIPNPDFLRKTIPQFKQEEVGVVQTRWGHLNKEKMMLTELQAFGLNGHFSIEQTGRNQSGHFINFNGTGGVWRKKCIEDSGGWSSDTLTEDLDLSYRAQMNGWGFVYLEEVEAPAELPETITALKNQQHRWMKGGAECLLKNGKKLISHPSISISNKIHGIFHLFNSSVFICIFLIAILSVPIVILRAGDSAFNSLFYYESIFFVATVILYFYYYFSFRDKKSSYLEGILLFTLRFIQFLTVSLGLSYNNAKAVFEAYRGKKSGFVRTPKFNGKKLKNKITDYPKNKIQLLVEFLLLIYFLFGLFYAVLNGIYGLIPFQIMLVSGYGYVVFQTYQDIYLSQEKDNFIKQPETLNSKV